MISIFDPCIKPVFFEARPINYKLFGCFTPITCTSIKFLSPQVRRWFDCFYKYKMRTELAISLLSIVNFSKVKDEGVPYSDRFAEFRWIKSFGWRLWFVLIVDYSQPLLNSSTLWSACLVSTPFEGQFMSSPRVYSRRSLGRQSLNHHFWDQA